MLRHLIHLFTRAKAPELHYLSIACIAKDENKYLKEWITYHQKIGVDHFYIYDNDSTEPIEKTLKESGLLPFATVIRFPGKSKHIQAYSHCLKKYGNRSRWIAFIDVDEFIVPKDPVGNLPAILKDYEPYGGLGINWFIFGSSGELKYVDSPVTSRFQLRSQPDFGPNNHIKSVVQPRYVKSAFKSHCFKFKKGYNCVNEKFSPIPDSFSENSTDRIQLNHYYCRSLEEYHEKVNRGISDTKRKRKLEEFHYHDGESNKIRDDLAFRIANTDARPKELSVQ